MRLSSQKGFSFVELLVVLGVVGLIAVVGWGALTGWAERNAVTYVSQNIKHIFEKYRQKAVDKGYNYGLMFGPEGIYVFEDNGGTGADRFTKMNNFALDVGEFSDLSDEANFRVTDNSDYSIFEPSGTPGVPGILMIQTQQTLDPDATWSDYRAWDPFGVDITQEAYAVGMLPGGTPFQGGQLALFFCPDGKVYLKDPTNPIQPLDKYLSELGNNGVDSYYVVRIAYDRMDTSAPEVPYFYEIAVNRYGATTMVRWHTGDGGGTWNAEVQ